MGKKFSVCEKKPGRQGQAEEKWEENRKGAWWCVAVGLWCYVNCACVCLLSQRQAWAGVVGR